MFLLNAVAWNIYKLEMRLFQNQICEETHLHVHILSSSTTKLSQ